MNSYTQKLNKKLVYYIFNVHVDNRKVMWHTKTKSDCPIEAVKQFLKQIKMSHSHLIKPKIIDKFVCEPSFLSACENIPFICKYLHENKKYYDIENVKYEHYCEMLKMIEDYITTPNNALKIIDWIEQGKFDTYYFEVIDCNSKFIKFIVSNIEEDEEDEEDEDEEEEDEEEDDVDSNENDE